MIYSTTMSSSTATETMILLSDWISRTIDEISQKSRVLGIEDLPACHRKSIVIFSDDYLLTALRVSFALVNSICKAEEDGDKPLPIPNSKWSEGIAIADNEISALKSIDDSQIKVENGDHENCVEVSFLPSLFNNDVDDSGRNCISNIHHIYSLGLVFYEMFSGGERPTEFLNGAQKSTDASLESFDHENAVNNFDPLPFDHLLSDDADPFEFGDDHSLLGNIIDDFEVEESQSLPKKRHTRPQHYSAVSLEPLKSKWIPGPLCDLIANMLDSTSCPLTAEDSYEKMIDVRDDLKLMMEKPATFFFDQDMNKLSVTGLQFGDTMFGREEELSRMKEAYQRSKESGKEMIILSGPSGSGKSLLAHEFGKFVSSEGGIVLSGKFDQLQQGKPFSALASAFDVYCGNLLENSSHSSSAKVLASKLISTLGGEVYHLTKLIPNLALILGSDVVNIIGQDQVCDHPQERLLYLFCKFVEVISIAFKAQLTLFLDDLQWADTASIAAVNQLLFTTDVSSSSTKRSTQLFFFGCCREGAINKDHCVWKLLCTAKVVGVKYTNVKLDHFEENALNVVVSELLHLSPRLTRSLSRIIYHKTKGNAFFVTRLLLTLSKDGLLRPSLTRRRWEWDVDKIQGKKLPDDVALFIADSIEALPKDVKFATCALSCFGASLEANTIKLLEKTLKKSLINNLDRAVREGLLDKKSDQYCFSHDRIQEAAYSLMPLVDRCDFHFFYGMALAPLKIGENDDSNLFIAANQINLAGPEAVKNDSQYAIVADLNLRAGKKAMEMSDFAAAYSYLDNGISFLRKNHWKENYALSLELFDMAARCAATNGEIEILKIFHEQVLARGKSFEDKLNVMYSFTCALALSSQLRESIDMGLNILSKLGINLPLREASMGACVQETKNLLSNYSDDEILSTRRMTDPTMIIAMKFLGKLEAGMTQIMPKSVAYVTQRIIQLSLVHGMSPVSPIGFVHIGSYMAKLGDIMGGYHYVKLALDLLDKVGSRESAGEVIFFATPIRGYVEPYQAALEHHDEGFSAAMSYGDVFMAACNCLLSCTSSLFAGNKLQPLQEKCIECANFMYERKVLISVVQLQEVQRSVFKLTGTDEKPKYISEVERHDILATNNSVMTTSHYQKAYISFIFRSYDLAKENIDKYIASISNTWANLLQQGFQSFYIGLIAFWCARKSDDSKLWYERGRLFKMAMKKWAETSLWTFEHKWLLMEAEEAYCNNNIDVAKVFYERAIASAKEHKFINDEALAYELAAYFYLQMGHMEKAVELFLQAHEKYTEWGAYGKCTSLFEFVKSNFTSVAGSALT